jgi:hypothetical protein
VLSRLTHCLLHMLLVMLLLLERHLLDLLTSTTLMLLMRE